MHHRAGAAGAEGMRERARGGNSEATLWCGGRMHRSASAAVPFMGRVEAACMHFTGCVLCDKHLFISVDEVYNPK